MSQRVRRFTIGLAAAAMAISLAVGTASAAAKSLAGSSALVAAQPAKGPAGLRFYTPPKKLTGSHGDLIWWRPLRGRDALTGAARNYLLLYRSTSISGNAIAVSGTLSIPKGKAPKGGWPVISFAHGTTGVARVCAPSLSPVGYPGYPQLLNAWLKAGYAIAQTDYEGLGTPGPAPFLIGESEGRSVVDIVSASRQLVPSLSKDWVAAGHSQGGHAALFAAALGPHWAPALKLKGVDAFAPVSQLKTEVELSSTVTAPGGGISAGGALLVAGAAAAYPSAIKPADLLTPRAFKLFPQVETKCVDQLSANNSWGQLPPADIISPTYNRAPFYAVLTANEPSNLHLTVPTLIQQGTADTTVFPFLTDQLVASLKANGAKIDYKKYQGADHSGVVQLPAPVEDSTAWLKKDLK
jgi:pimeloyl-ACP methyl ester carboxylesterase